MKPLAKKTSPKVDYSATIGDATFVFTPKQRVLNGKARKAPAKGRKRAANRNANNEFDKEISEIAKLMGGGGEDTSVRVTGDLKIILNRCIQHFIDCVVRTFKDNLPDAKRIDDDRMYDVLQSILMGGCQFNTQVGMVRQIMEYVSTTLKAYHELTNGIRDNKSQARLLTAGYVVRGKEVLELQDPLNQHVTPQIRTESYQFKK
jgi:hypothetical protein